MSESIILSRTKLETFLTCQRRFTLRYRQKMAWPEQPLPLQSERLLQQGKLFHQLIERHFLGVPVEPLVDDDRVRTWWRLFQHSEMAAINGRLLPEHTLTIPLGQHLLTGRFDLLVLEERDGEPFVHIFDWKTGHPRQKVALRQDWQTRVYLAMVMEGHAALWENGRTLPASHITLTYWYAQDAQTPITFTYSDAWHTQNWAEMTQTAEAITQALAGNQWPLTDNLAACSGCAFQVYCGRQAASSSPTSAIDVDALPPEDEASLFVEPDLP
jgi:hypothetical protein